MRSLIFVTVLFSTEIARAQSGTVAALNQNIMYAGVENPAQFAVPGLSCRGLFAQVEKGRVTMDKDNPCTFYVCPVAASIGKTIDVSICSLRRGKVVQIFSFPFRIKAVPDGVAVIRCGGESGYCSTKESLARSGVKAVVENFEYAMKIHVEAYTLTHKSKKGRSESFTTNSGSRFTAEMQRQLLTTQTGDSILITSIKGRYPDSTLRLMNDIRVVIPEDY